MGGMAYGQSATEGGRGLPIAAPSVSPWEERWENRRSRADTGGKKVSTEGKIGPFWEEAS